MKTIINKYQSADKIQQRSVLLSLLLSFLLSPIQSVLADSTDLYPIQPITITNSFKSTGIDSFITVWQTSEKLMPKELVNLSLQNKIEQASQSTTQGFSFFYFWVNFSIKNESDTIKKLYLEIARPQIDTIALYEQTRATNNWKQIAYGGGAVSFYKRTTINRRFIFPINLKPNERKTFLLMIDKRKTSVNFPLKLWDQQVFNKQEGKSNLLFHLYFGSLLTITILTIVIGLLFRNKILISYSIYVAFMGFFIFTSLGFSFQFIYPEMPILSSRIRFPFSIILLITFMEFSNSFIGTNQFSKKASRFFYILYGISILNLAIWLTFHDYMLNFPGLLVSIQYFIILLSFSIISYILIKYYKQNKQKTIYYAVAMLALIGGFIFYLFIEYGFIETTGLIIHPLMLGSGMELLIFTFAIIIEIKKINDKKNELILVVAENQKKILNAFIKGSELEGKRISLELHDNIGSRLALLKNKIAVGNSTKKELDCYVKSIYEDVRKLSHDLSPNILNIIGLQSTIEQYLFDFSISGNIKAELFYSKVPELPENIKLQLFRVIQESAQNCLRHSKADKLNIQVIGYGNELILTIDDNGKGFKTDNLSTIKGNGINNMKTRIASINGEFEISSSPGKGTFIVINLPI